MTEARAGRLLAACMHQAITELLPDRLEFYESWLGPKGWRDGSRGLAPMRAVMSFLRTEGDAYHQVMTRAGVLAAEWSVASLSAFERRVTAWLPRTLRVRAAVRVAARTIRETSTQSRTKTRVSGSTAHIEIKDSVFCAVREPQRHPLCKFHAAAATTTLVQLGVLADGRIEKCHAVGGGPCIVALDLLGEQVSDAPARAA